MDLDGIRVEGNRIYCTGNEGNQECIEIRSEELNKNVTIDKITIIDNGLSLQVKMDSGEEYIVKNFRNVATCLIRKKAVTFSDIAFINRG